MVAIPQQYDDIAKAVYDLHAGVARGKSLSAGWLANKCTRAMWYQIRWGQPAKVDGKSKYQRIIEGRAREFFFEVLLNIGVKLEPKNLDCNVEMFYPKMFGGHIEQRLQAAACGLPHRGPKWHVIEFYLLEHNAFNLLKRKGLQQSNYDHFCRAQYLMGATGMDRTMYVAQNENADLHFEVIEYKEQTFNALIEKAESALFSEMPPAKINAHPDYEDCQKCPFNGICHYTDQPLEKSCRTCISSTPKADGTWHCNFDFLPVYHKQRSETQLSFNEQIEACDQWLSIATKIPVF